ncbi:GlsB/YeaQ/YmgE family stress response membrane protein [Novosphingobium sp. B 225]|uniref:GlsB/YeaQ/YmgE family stress response membrane protein n=1 Tax=Novosphingobium sp. B 225 TaxID=1961849 RepID=UPI000B4B6CEE|nr:GlsB/YeaQ/YmgE family stress response membrane protein [Novosphingobium sp. B 225]
MKYVSMAVMGLIVGALAKLFYVGDNGNGWLMSMVLGLAGSFGAGFVGSMLDKEPGTQLKPAGFIYSVLGAMILIFVAKRLGLQV